MTSQELIRAAEIYLRSRPAASLLMRIQPLVADIVALDDVDDGQAPMLAFEECAKRRR